MACWAHTRESAHPQPAARTTGSTQPTGSTEPRLFSRLLVAHHGRILLEGPPSGLLGAEPLATQIPADRGAGQPPASCVQTDARGAGREAGALGCGLLQRGESICKDLGGMRSVIRAWSRGLLLKAEVHLESRLGD